LTNERLYYENHSDDLGSIEEFHTVNRNRYTLRLCWCRVTTFHAASVGHEVTKFQMQIVRNCRCWKRT